MKNLLALLFSIALLTSLCGTPANASYTPEERITSDLPLMDLGRDEARRMADHVISTGSEDQTTEGIWFYCREYDGGKAKPPGVDEYYNMRVFFIYVPRVASGIHIGIEYELREGEKNEWGDPAVRKVIQIKIDDADEDLIPNSMIRVDMEFNYGKPVKYEYESVDAFLEWQYWVHFWYETFIKEGMK